MSKTPFRMPQRAELPRAELDHWVAGGERPATAPEGTLRHERPSAKVARLTIDLPPALHARIQGDLRPQRYPDDRRGTPAHRGLDTEKRVSVFLSFCGSKTGGTDRDGQVPRLHPRSDHVTDRAGRRGGRAGPRPGSCRAAPFNRSTRHLQTAVCRGGRTPEVATGGPAAWWRSRRPGPAQLASPCSGTIFPRC